MDERNMMHGIDYRDEDVRGWLLSEKINGCRAFWDGHDLWTRGGRLIAAPSWMRARLPEGIALDGEVNAGRGGFETARQAVQYGRFTEDVQFSAFDAPDAPGTFAQRYDFLRYILPDRGIVNYIPHRPCEDIQDATDEMLAIQADRGEGVVLRYPFGLYHPGRTETLLKLKLIPEALYDRYPVPALR